jgi:hypothetical protein
MAGTAGAVHHHQEKKWAAQDADAQQEQYEQESYEQEQQDAPPPEQYETADAEEDLTAKLQELGKLHESGVLTDEEFAAAKSKLLAS